MLFHEKLSLLKEALGTTSSALARSSGLDASCICRYLGAKTQPPRYGKAVASIAAGAAKLAVDDKRVRELRRSGRTKKRCFKRRSYAGSTPPIHLLRKENIRSRANRSAA